MTGETRAEPEGDLLAGLAREVTAALGELVGHDGRLNDPLAEDGRSPDDHYGHLGAALAIYLTNPTDERASRLVDYWLSLAGDERGHGPFNHFLGLLLLDAARRGGDDGMERRAVRIAAEAKLRRHYPSNNWSLLAQLCRVFDSDGARRRRATRKLVQLFDRWMTDAGGFVDFPERRHRPGEGATPACYHHKALFIATVALVHTGDADLVPVVQQLLAWSLMTCDGHGYAGGFGRSTHALFGDACLMFALRVLSELVDSPESLVAAERAIARRLGLQRRPDGLLDLNPAGCTGWDAYMYLSVYNAWAAALLNLAQSAAGCGAASGARLATPSTRLDDDRGAGLHRIDCGGAGTLLISSAGQPPQALGRRDAELRYAGGAPFHMSLDGAPRIAPPTRITLADALAQPALAGWVVLLQHDDATFSGSFTDVARFDEPRGSRVAMSGYAVPVTRAAPRSVHERLLYALDWRLLGGRIARRHSLTRTPERQIGIEMTLGYDADTRTLLQTLEVRNDANAALVILNPGGHALLGQPEAVEVSVESGLQPATAAQSWHSAPLHSSLPGATGRCLAPITVAAGSRYSHRLTVRWPS